MSSHASSPDLGSWRPTRVVADVLVDPAPVAALQSLLDSGAATIEIGDDLPPLWHWVALPRWTASSRLAADGHERRGALLPPVRQPRRMWGGGEIVLHRPARVGEMLHRQSRVTSVEEKDSRVGLLTILAVDTRVTTTAGEVVIEERQDLLYRDTPPRDSASIPARPTPLEPGPPIERRGTWSWGLRTDPSLLMRFSAATANAHRIHYDWPYATGVEGYPGLLVHGPLLSLAMAEVVRLERPDARVMRVRHRNRAPLFCGDTASISRAPIPPAGGDAIDLTVVSDGRVCAEISFELHG